MALNEEAIKAKLVLPLIRSLGVAEDEIELETTFSIQLGRGVYTVKGEEAELATGRLDILCRTGGRPLLVIELKAEGEKLTEADRRQGLSYARLMEPMAPWVLVSNGRQTELYNTLTGEPAGELGRGSVASLQPDLASELALRFEALENFIGYSAANLFAFCKAHNYSLLAKLRAIDAEPTEAQLKKKYIPAAYVNRKEIEDSFEEFLVNENKVIFPIVGESGTGKTNLICHLVERSANRPQLYYSGSLLGPSLLREVALDFNLAFSPQELGLGVVRKISALAIKHGQPLLLSIDAIDEWEAPDKAAQLSELAELAHRFRIKVVLACKKAIWPVMLSRRGLPTALADGLYANVPELEDFNLEEAGRAVRKYSRLLGAVHIPGNAALSLANPFAMRIAFEVAFRQGVPLDVGGNSRSTLARYLELKLVPEANGDHALRFLTAIGRVLFEQNKAQTSEAKLREALGLRLHEEIPSELFSQNILYRYVDESGAVMIGFYFTLLRDHVISVLVMQLDKVASEAKTAAFKYALANYIGESALIYFMRSGDEDDLVCCVNAAIEIDMLEERRMLLPKLLSWYGKPLHGLVQRQAEIFEHLKAVLSNNADDINLARQIISVLELWPPSPDLERLLVDCFDIISRQSGPAELISERLSTLLSHYKQSICTDRLIELVVDSERSGYVRRYIARCLAFRRFGSRRDVFVRLLADQSGDVRMYVRDWYKKLEDVRLRDQLLGKFDTANDSGIRADIALTLSLSSLGDTGEKIFCRWHEAVNTDEHVRSWMARSLARLKYRKAIPEFMRLFRRDPYSRLSEHLLLSLGEMRAREVLPALFRFIKNGDERLEVWWIVHAFSATAGAADYIKVEEIARKANSKPYARFLATLILAVQGGARYSPVVRNFVSDTRVIESRRITVLQQWELPGVVGLGRMYKSQRRRNGRVSRRGVETLYALLAEGSGVAVIAIGLLMNIESNAKKFSEELKAWLPRLTVAFRGNEVLIANRNKLEGLAPLIRPWLNAQLYAPTIAPTHIANCLTMIEYVGDQSSLDALNANRSRLDKVIDRQSLEHAEATIRQYGGQVRLGVRGRV